MTDDGVTVAYDVAGPPSSPSTIVVIPGFWRTRGWPSLRSFADLLVSKGYRVAVLDLRGHGDSGGRYTFNREEARDVEAVIRDLVRLDGARVIELIGFSVGGAIATVVAARREVETHSLTLISPVARFGWIRPRLNPFKFSRHLSAGQALRMPRFEWSFPWSRKEVAVESMRGVGVPVLVIHAKRDWLIHHRHGLALHEAAGAEATLHLLELGDGYHADRIFSAAPGIAESRILEFLERCKSKRPPEGGRGEE